MPVRNARLWVAVSGALVCVALAALIGWNLTAALDRSRRDTELVGLKAQINVLHEQIGTASGDADQLLATIDQVSADNDSTAGRIDGQEAKVASLKRQIAKLNKEIAALQG